MLSYAKASLIVKLMLKWKSCQKLGEFVKK